MNISDYISLGALAISVASAAGSWCAYTKYGRKLNEQQTQINDFIIAQQEAEELKSRCADLKFKINGNRLIVKNDGQTEATDIELTFPSQAIVIPQKFPVTIKRIAAGASFQVQIRRATTLLMGIDMKFTWFDGRGSRQKAEQYVLLD